MVYSLNWLVFILISTFLFLTPARLLIDGDAGWHIMAGHYIIQNGAVPANNIFSFSNPEQKWENIAWLWDVVIAAFDSIGGLYAVAAFSIILASATLAAVCWLSQKRGAGIIASTIAILLGLTSFSPMILARPQLASYAFVVVYLVLLFAYSENPEAQRRKLLWLPLIMLFWVNMHGGFITGFTIIGAYMLRPFLQKNWREFFPLLLAAIASVAIVFINPQGLGIIDAVINTIGGRLTNYIHEWETPTDINYIIYLVAFTLVFFATFKHHSIADKFLCALWLFMGCSAARNMPIFMLVSTPVMASGIHYLIMQKPKFRAREKDFNNDLSLSKVSYVTAAAMVLLPLLLMTFKPTGFAPEKNENYAEEEVGYILATMPEARVFNHYDYGGYMIYQSEGKLKTFIDGRADTAFSDEVIDDYVKFHIAQPGWEALLDKYQIDIALMPRKLGIQLNYFKTHWRMVYEGEKAIVYTRN